MDNALEIGNKQKDNFNEGLPNGFFQLLTKEITTMAVTKEVTVFVTVFDTEIISARVMCFGQIQLQESLGYELSPIRTLLFRENGKTRPSDSKSDLK